MELELVAELGARLVAEGEAGNAPRTGRGGDDGEALAGLERELAAHPGLRGAVVLDEAEAVCCGEGDLVGEGPVGGRGVDGHHLIGDERDVGRARSEEQHDPGDEEVDERGEHEIEQARHRVEHRPRGPAGQARRRVSVAA